MHWAWAAGAKARATREATRINLDMVKFGFAEAPAIPKEDADERELWEVYQKHKDPRGGSITTKGTRTACSELVHQVTHRHTHNIGSPLTPDRERNSDNPTSNRYGTPRRVRSTLLFHRVCADRGQRQHHCEDSASAAFQVLTWHRRSAWHLLGLLMLLPYLSKPSTSESSGSCIRGTRSQEAEKSQPGERRQLVRSWPEG